MAVEGPEEYATNQGELGGSLTTTDRIELLPTAQSQPPVSGLPDDDTQYSGDGERRNCVEDGDKRQNNNGKENKDAVEKKNQDGNKTDGVGQKDDDTLEHNDVDEHEAKSGNQEWSNETDERITPPSGSFNVLRRGIQSHTKALDQQDRGDLEFDVSNMIEFKKVFGSGKRIPNNPLFPLPFTASFLEKFVPIPGGVKHRIEVIEKHLKYSRRSYGSGTLCIIDVPVFKMSDNYSYKYPITLYRHEGWRGGVEYFKYKTSQEYVSMKYGRIVLLEGASLIAKMVKSPIAHEICPMIRCYNRIMVSNSPAEWAITILAPSSFYSGLPEFTFGSGPPLGLEFPAESSSAGLDTMLRVITKATEIIVDNWQKLFDEVRKECDSENVSFMDSEKYVHLLYDDANFRRSRFYFWAIGCLSSFEQSVDETLWELRMFQTEVSNKAPLRQRMDGGDDFKRIYTKQMEDFRQACKNLEGIHDQLVKKRDEMKVLRDGLFSASSVMESRQSRILGENVQLLAFVTIFFLPLAFSASLWSIPGVNEKYPGIMIPGASAAVIGFVTYFIVFNLNLFISGLRRLFSVPRSFLLTRMAAENPPNDDLEYGGSVNNSASWPTRAKTFEAFPRRDESPTSSNWLLLFYAIRILIISIFDLVIRLLAWLRGIIAPKPPIRRSDVERSPDEVPKTRTVIKLN
ncbi:hypothetical protein V490_00083 [Pseudogymnoascus sp. VKM F-3557]|nr:hypothetical protein V490_00083 [Pseudogymnoascus sp. VKM F-3557]